MDGQPEPAGRADAIWDRAALNDGGPRPRYGDAALSAVLRLHSLTMSGGLLDAVERLADPELDAAERGYAWLGHPDAAQVVAYVRDQIRDGALTDADRAEHLEHEADQQYTDLIDTDTTVYVAFRHRLATCTGLASSDDPPADASRSGKPTRTQAGYGHNQPGDSVTLGAAIRENLTAAGLLA